jgi:hypothetical protein
LLGCYSESGQPPSDLVFPTLVLGGIHAADFVASSSSAYTFLDGVINTRSGTAALPAVTYNSDKTTGLFLRATGILGLAVSGAERGIFTNYAKFTSNGSYFSSAGLYHEFVQSSATQFSSVDYITSVSYTGIGKHVKSETASGTGYNLITASNAAGATFVVLGNGNAQNTNNSYGAISDVKLKQDIIDAPSQWDDIKSLKLRKYRFKTDPTGPMQIGVVAQELESVSPGLVDSIPDRDDEGVLTGEFTKSVKYSVLLIKALGALQEAQSRIETLEAKISLIENK